MGILLCNFHVAPDPAESVGASVSLTAQIYPMLSLFATFMHLDYCNNQFQTATISTISHAWVLFSCAKIWKLYVFEEMNFILLQRRANKIEFPTWQQVLERSKWLEFLISDAKKLDQSAFLGASNLNVASLWHDYNLSSSISLTFKFYLPALKSGIYPVILVPVPWFKLPLH